jgi:nitrous oxidase accessory protein NosD
VIGLSVTPSAASTLVVDDDLAQCPTAAYTSIQVAAMAAVPGDTIKVCPGTYTENVLVTKPLTFLGAQAGKDARRDRNNLQKESVLNHANGGFTGVGLLSNVTIDGFTIQGQGLTSRSGIDFSSFSSGGSGYQILNNVIQNWWRGVGFNSNGTYQTLFRHNLIRGRTGPISDAPAGGIEGNTLPVNNTVIDANLFTANENSAVVIITPSAGLTISNNLSVGDDTFVALFNGSETDTIVDNVGTGFSGSAMFFGGGNDGVIVDHNDLRNGLFNGIRFNNAFGNGPDTNMVITNNTVMAMGVSGLNAAPNSLVGSTIQNNRSLRNAEDGIRLSAGDSGNEVSENSMRLNRIFDAHDESTGTGTADTANIWTNNNCKTSSPEGLCAKP